MYFFEYGGSFFIMQPIQNPVCSAILDKFAFYLLHEFPENGAGPITLNGEAWIIIYVTIHTSVSPVRILIARSTGMTKILPSPIFPVRADSMIVFTTVSVSFSLTTISI